MKLIWAFLRRDLKIAASYRLSLVLVILGGLLTLTTLHFLAAVMRDAPALGRYRGDYFSFALIGVAVTASLRSLQTSFSHRLREAQTDGSLEILLASPLSTFRLVLHLAAYPILSALVRASGLLLAGALLFNAGLRVNWLSFGITLALSLLCFGAIGLLSAAVVLIFKRTDPFTYVLDSLSYLFCGIIYPVEVMPAALQWVSRLLPATYAVKALREAALQHGSFAEVRSGLEALMVFCILLWPIAALSLSWARRHVERTGTLAYW